MANNDDYLTVEEAKVDLRIDDANGFSDADLESLQGPCASGLSPASPGEFFPTRNVGRRRRGPGLESFMLGRDGNALGRFVRRFRLPSMRWPPPTETFSRRRREFRGRCALRFFYFPIVWDSMPDRI